jgi:SSS family solute:Na+ symporter
LPADVDAAALATFGAIVAAGCLLGFLAAGWRRRGSLVTLHDWALAGRSFGGVITWFLLGGTIFTAYTFIALPALTYRSGSLGFFAVPYTIIVFQILYLVGPRLWRLAARHGHITLADLVAAEHGSRVLALLVALTGLLATMPYVALQLVGIRVVVEAMGVPATGTTADAILVVTFGVLAAFTYTSGIRAPALMSVVKDVLIVVSAGVLLIVAAHRLGGLGSVITAGEAALPGRAETLPSEAGAAYLSLAVGSALALLLYPHVATSLLAAGSGRVLQRNAVALPFYTALLAVIALLGLVVLADGISVPAGRSTLAIPLLVTQEMPSWAAGVTFAAIALGGLVPAAVMSIAAANLFARNIYTPYLRPTATPTQQTQVAKVMSLLIKFGAIVFVIGLKTQDAINLQLLGGVWILQTLPAVGAALYGRRVETKALIAGWTVGIMAGSWMAVAEGFRAVYPIVLGAYEIKIYPALLALALNAIVVSVSSAAIHVVRRRTEARDGTAAPARPTPGLEKSW